MSGKKPTFSDIKAAFEARSKPTTASTPPRSSPAEIAANAMFPIKTLKPVKASIDTILDTAKSSLQLPSSSSSPPAAAPPTPAPTPTTTPTPSRPTAAQRPSWIGPPQALKPVTLGGQAMKQPVTVEYASAGLQPPVYVFTSLSDPQWDAVEMNQEKKDGGEYRFYKTFSGDEGEYQYKFRLGPGDWWALDDSKPTVDDGMGNKNNLMVVKPSQPAQSAATPAQAPAMPQIERPEPADQPQPASIPPVENVKQQDAPSTQRPATISIPTAAADPKPDVVPTPQPGPLMKHEALAAPSKEAPKDPTVQLPIRSLANQPRAAPGAAPMAPLMKHESFFPDADSGAQRRADGMDDDEDEASLVEPEEDDEEHPEHQSPLLRHETLGPDAEEQIHSPLLRHESGGIGEHPHDPNYEHSRPSLHDWHSRSSNSNPADSISPEADPDDDALHPFPTDHAGIFEHIHRTSTQLPEDETNELVNVGSPLSAARNTSTSPVRSLPSLAEQDEDEELEELREYNREKAAQQVKHEEVVPELKVTEPNGRFTQPITPPMTPLEAERIIERVVEEAEEERTIERIVEKVLEHEARETVREDARREEIIVEIVQDRGRMGVLADVVAHPFSWLAIAGIAIAIAARIWKIQPLQIRRSVQYDVRCNAISVDFGCNCILLTPSPGLSDIRVEVKAISLNPIDPLYVAHPLGSTGRTVGSDFAGIVSSLGSSAARSSELESGDRVSGFLQGACSVNDRTGAFAENLVVPHDLVWNVPDEMELEEAAGVSLVALTAAQGLWYRLGLRAPFEYDREEVLLENPEWKQHEDAFADEEELNFFIYGASTSVGLYAAQMARLSAKSSGKKLKLFGAASKARWEMLKAEPYGYDHLVDYRDADWPHSIRDLSGGKGMHYVYDCISEGDSVERSCSALREGGRSAIVRSRQAGAWSGSNFAIEPIYGTVWEGLGEVVQYKGMVLKKSAAARDFTVKFYRWLGGAMGLELKAVPVRLMPGGLEKVVEDGFVLLGAGTMEERGWRRTEEWMRPVSAERLVYRI